MVFDLSPDCLRLLFIRIIWCFLFDGVRNQSNNFPFLVNRNPSKTVENHRFCRGQYAFHQFDTRKTTQQKEHQISPSNSKYMHNTSTMNNFSLKKMIFQTNNVQKWKQIDVLMAESLKIHKTPMTKLKKRKSRWTYTRSGLTTSIFDNALTLRMILVRERECRKRTRDRPLMSHMFCN